MAPHAPGATQAAKQPRTIVGMTVGGGVCAVMPSAAIRIHADHAIISWAGPGGGLHGSSAPRTTPGAPSYPLPTLFTNGKPANKRLMLAPPPLILF